MSEPVDFVSVIGFDIVHSADPKIPGEIQEKRKKAFHDYLNNLKTHNDLKSNAFMIDTGDGAYLIVDTNFAAKLLDVVKELQKNLEAYNKLEKNPEWHIKIRTGINVGPANVKREGKKLVKVAGNAINYTKRIMDIGQEDHILLTSSAVTTILSIDHTYHDKIQYVGEYTVRHEQKFNVHNYFDKGIGNSKIPPKQDDSKKQKSVNSLIVVSVIIAFSIVLITVISLHLVAIDTYQNNLRENQYHTVKHSIINKIQNFIDNSNVLESTIKAGYTENQNKTMFIDKRIDELGNSDLFVIDKKPIHDSLYFYILSPYPECDFLLYPFVKDMLRLDAKGLESCDLVNLDLYVTSNYPSTGAGTFVNTVVQKIRLDDNTGYDLTTGITIDWDVVSEDIRSDIKSSDVKFVLVDRDQFLVMECTVDKCNNMKSYANDHGPITPSSHYLKYSPNNYTDYKLYKEDIFEDKDFHTYDTLRNRILEGWKLMMFVK